MNGKLAKQMRKFARFHPKMERDYEIMDGTKRPLMRMTGELDNKGKPIFEQYGFSYTLRNQKESARAAYQRIKAAYSKYPVYLR